MDGELSLDMEDEDFDSDDSSKDTKNLINDSSFTTESIINYGKEYERINRIYTKKQLNHFNKLLESKKLNKLNGELDLSKKEKINWKYLYVHVLKIILPPVNINKIDINKTINIHEISQRIKYCLLCTSSLKENGSNEQKNNLIPKIIEIFSHKGQRKHRSNNNNYIKSFSNEKVIKEENKANTISNQNEITNSKKLKLKKKLTININNIKFINNDEQKRKTIFSPTNMMRKKTQEKLKGKNILLIDDVKNPNNNNVIMEYIGKKNEEEKNIIKNIPSMSDDVLFDIKQKKKNSSTKRNAFNEAMTDFNLKNCNIEIKDKTFCNNFFFFPMKDNNYDNENDLEKRGERIMFYNNLADNLVDLLDL